MSSLLPSLVDSIRGTAERELDSVAPDEPIVDVTDVSVTLGSVQALDSVSLEVEQGEFLGVIGPNGAGKTTLLRTISGVLSPSGGTVTVDGQDITALPSKASSRLVAVVPQETSLAFDFTVREVVEMGRTPYRNRMTLESSADEEMVTRALERTQTAAFADRDVGEVSGGERQRVLLARALAQDTPVLLLDEPTASLDINHQIRTLELVKSLVEEGKTIMAPIHDLNLAAHYCDRLLLLADGKRTALGSPNEVLTESNLETAFGTDAVVTNNPVTGSVYVMALPDGARDRDGPHVHVIGGGGSAARLLYLLAASGYQVTTGALNEGDADTETARMLGIDAVTLEPYAPIDEASAEQVTDQVESAAVTVIPDLAIGHGNLPNLRAAAHANDLILVEDRPFEERNYAGVRGEARYDSLRERGTVVESRNVLEAVESVIESS
ncbi:heme ABC transporter ATP-binding protein [Halodesulfurarchaeum sp. HSR-GB]|nr:heme ABC transporter ATP-binding protein [Halodesulfurarchaeum sp. HSR-GB]MDR5656557.1 heme ABC transporter ATP-binding protein [Halodesulfurarchaeum sp. HSR-GB]